MNIEPMMRLEGYYKETETERIHKEIFKESYEYKHYILGIAQGFYFIYDLVKQYEDKFNADELLTVIENFPCEDKLLKDYFIRIKNSK